MRIRVRLWIGLIALSCLTVAVTAAGMLALWRQSQASSAVVQENFRSLEYVTELHALLNQLEASPDRQGLLVSFDNVLHRQEINITEAGEAEATQQVRRAFVQLQQTGGAASVIAMRQGLDRIAQLNQVALRAKNAAAQQTADNQLALMAGMATLVFLFLFTFLYSYPASLVEPLETVTRKISAVAEGAYAQQIEEHEHRHDEIGDLTRAFNRMSQQLVAYQQTNIDQLSFERSRLHAVLDTLPEALVVLDAERRLLVVNPAAEKLLGLDEAAVVGLLASEVALRHDLLRVLVQPVLGDAPVRLTPLAVAVEGVTRQYLPEVVAVRGEPDGTGAQPPLMGHVLGLVDVTEFHERDLAKTRFLATVSHELKTPLAGISLSVRMLEDARVGGLNAEQQQLVGSIREQTDRLRHLTGELLDLTQLESGKIALHLHPTDVAGVVAGTVAALQLLADERRVHIEVQMPEGVQVLADADKLRWVVSNLLVNAIRYSPEGGAVRIWAEQEAAGLRLCVCDAGPGIPAAHRAQLFERYYRAPGQSGGGTGLGLAVSREFVEAMGGTLTLDDTAGGAQFSVRLRGG